MTLFHDATQKTAATGLYKPATIGVRDMTLLTVQIVHNSNFQKS